MSAALLPIAGTAPLEVAYHAMRAAVEECADIGKAAELRDQAAAITLYAAQRGDRELQVWTAEIRARAAVRLGLLISQIDRARCRGHGVYRKPKNGMTKAEVLARAGLNAGTAYALQELAGGDDAAHQADAHARAEAYFTVCRRTRTPATMVGLRRATLDGRPGNPCRSRRQAGRAAPEPPAPAPVPPAADDRPQHSSSGDPFIRFLASVRLIVRTPPADLRRYGARAGIAAAALRAEAEHAERALSEWIAVLCVVSPVRAAPEVAMHQAPSRAQSAAA